MGRRCISVVRPTDWIVTDTAKKRNDQTLEVLRSGSDAVFLTAEVAGRRPSSGRIPAERGDVRRPTCSPGGSVRDLGAGLTDHALDDLGEPLARVGEGVEVVLALAAAIDDTAKSQEGQVVAHGGLPLGQLLA
jgi:hypothetical protein